MKTNDLPLVTPTVLKTSQKNASAATQTSQVQTQVEATSTPSKSTDKTTFKAEVVASRPDTDTVKNTDKATENTKQSWQITLRAEGRNLTVYSEQPLPKGSQLTLITDNGQPPKVEVIDIKLPAQPSSAKNIASLLQSLATQLKSTNSLGNGLPASVKDLLSSRIQWQMPSASSTQITSAHTALNSTYQNGATASIVAKTTATITSNAQLESLNAKTTGLSSNTPTSSLLLQLLNRPLAAGTLPTMSASSDALPGKLPLLAQSFVQSQPTAMQLASPLQLKTAIQNAPINYERQVISLLTSHLQTLAASTSTTSSGTGLSTTSVAQIFKLLWAKTGATSTQQSNQQSNLSPHQPSGSLSLSQSTTEASNTAKPSLATLIAQLRGVSAQPDNNRSSTISSVANNPVTTNPTTGNPTTGNPTTGNSVALSAALLSTLADEATSTNTLNLQTTSANISTSNLKGLLLNLAHQWPKDQQALPASLATVSTRDPSLDVKADAFRLIQTALSQIEHEQVRLTQSSDQFQIPLLWRDGQQLQQALMDVKQENSESDKTGEKTNKKHRWQITLHFDLAGLGPLDIELDLCLPGVSATFWSDQADTLASLNQALQPLRQTLTELGADVGELKARHGRKPPGIQPIVRHSLVDIHT